MADLDSTPHAAMGSEDHPPSAQIPEVDCLIVGAGFGAYTVLNKLRKLGLKCTVYEKGSGKGGIWYWNCYPGARVDSDTPIYQLFDKELWSTFTFKERYAGWQELRRYFEHVDKVWDVKKDVVYNKHVDSATFDDKTHRWLVETSDGEEIYARWFIPCIGFASRRYTPPVPGLGNFRGDVYHTAIWPQHGVNMRGKRVAQIGTGASGIQVIQTIGPKVKHLTIYQRTPNYCLPMNQRKLDEKEEEERKQSGKYEEHFKATRTTFSGFDYDFVQKNTFDDSPEEQEKFFRHLLIEKGGFHYWLGTYKDMLYSQKANDAAYNFWRDETRKRITDEKKKELLCPTKPPHPWGTKRPSLEQNFYEVCNQDNVDIIDINADPITEVTPRGIVTQHGGEIEVDVLVLATGFDSVTGSLAQLNIQGTSGGTIADHWKDGTRTSMGIAIPEFPNMFFLYGPQAPTAFSNGPSCTQFQAEFIEKTLRLLLDQGITRFEATTDQEENWCRRMNEKWDETLFPLAKSWYQGSNVPGKKVEPLNWSGGMVEYVNSLNQSLENDYQGWSTAKLGS